MFRRFHSIVRSAIVRSAIVRSATRYRTDTSAAAVCARRAALALAGALLAGCVYAPERTIPDPLPEVRSWALAERPAGAFLGLTLVENDSGTLEDLTFASGVRVTAVVKNSPAAQVGLRIDDVVLEADGVELFAPEDLTGLLATRVGGDPLSLSVQRGDTVFEVPVTLVETGVGAAPIRPRFHLDPAHSRAAWSDGEGGAVLIARPDEGPARRIPVGTLVTHLDGEAVASGRGLVQRFARLAPGSDVEVTGIAPERDGGAGRPKQYPMRLLGEGRVVTRASVPVLFTYDANLQADRRSFVALDLWVISLFRYERDGGERRWRFLRFFQWSSGVGELSE